MILGNHRDAWVFGAVDPNSGTAVLMELARSLSVLRANSWRPGRTLVLCSWDAEEPGLIGSTEWVEVCLLTVMTGSYNVYYILNHYTLCTVRIATMNVNGQLFFRSLASIQLFTEL